MYSTPRQSGALHAEAHPFQPSQPSSVDRAAQARPETRLRYNKPAIAKFLAVVAVAASVMGYESTKGVNDSAHLHEVAQLGQPAGQVEHDLQTGALDAKDLVALESPTSDTASGEASDLVRAGLVPSSARDEVAGIIVGQVGSPAEGTGIVLPRGDVTPKAIETSAALLK